MSKPTSLVREIEPPVAAADLEPDILVEVPQERDYTQGSIHKAIWALAVPMTLEMGVGSVYQILDMIWVGRLGPAEVAAVSVSSTLIWVIVSAANGLGVGGMAIVARRIGARERQAANHATTQAVLLSVIVSLGLTVLGWSVMIPLLKLLGSGPDVLPLAAAYLRVTYSGLVLVVPLFVINALLRGAGNASAALIAFVLARGIAILVEPFLVLGWGPFPRWGVTGAALSSLIGMACGLAFQFVVLSRGKARIRLNLRAIYPDRALMWRIIQIGLPSTFQMMLRAASRLTILGLVGMFGTLALAGYGVANRILLVALIPGFGMGNAAGTLVGQNLGARKPDRAERSAWLIAGYNLAFMATFVGVTFLFAERLIAFFNATPGVVAYGTACLRIVAIGYLFSAVGVVMGRSLDGAGNTLPAMVINAITLWVITIPAAYLLAVGGMGITGVWIGLTVGNACNGLLLATWFRLGRWKRKKV